MKSLSKEIISSSWNYDVSLILSVRTVAGAIYSVASEAAMVNFDDKCFRRRFDVVNMAGFVERSLLTHFSFFRRLVIISLGIISYGKILFCSSFRA